MNVFPTKVTMPDGTVFTGCRVESDGRRLRIWHWTGNEAVIVHETGARAVVGTGPTWYLKTADGTVTILMDSTDCGCGHPFKRWTPSDVSGARRIYTDPEVSDATV